jgi:hypothetical protein
MVAVVYRNNPIWHFMVLQSLNVYFFNQIKDPVSILLQLKTGSLIHSVIVNSAPKADVSFQIDYRPKAGLKAI